MEDCNLLVADCAALSCCCQCLILQILLFIFIRIPRKFVRKTREFAKRKIRSWRKHGKGVIVESKGGIRFQEEFVRKALSIQIVETLSFGCMEEVEKVFEEMSLRGEFGFGSFWRRDGIGSTERCIEDVVASIDFVHCEFIEMGPLCTFN